MVRRSRWFEVVTLLSLLVVLSAGVTVAVKRGTEEKYPAAWDSRIVGLTQIVERERGALFDHPVPVDFLTPDEYSERTRTDEATLSDDEREETEQFEGALRALGILSGDTDLLEASNDLSDSGTLAYYDSLEERVVIRGTVITPALAVTLVHELTHVLQDQVFDLDRYDEGDDEVTSGQTYAFGAVVEGDADRIEARYVDTLDEATRAAIDEENDAGLDDFEEADIPVALTSLFGSMYGLGDAFLDVLDSAAGQSVDGAFSKPPVTEEQVFDPFAYIDGDGPATVAMPGTDGEEPYDEGDFGAVSLMVVLAERIDPRQALAAATGWGGDAFVVYPQGDRTCIRLNVTGDTPDDTAEIAAALSAWVDATPGGSASTSRDGDVVHLESCDPGSEAAGGNGGSMSAVQLAIARSYIAVGALDQGADKEQARCFGAAVVDGLTDEELAADDPSPALLTRVARLTARCR